MQVKQFSLQSFFENVNIAQCKFKDRSCRNYKHRVKYLVD